MDIYSILFFLLISFGKIVELVYRVALFLLIFGLSQIAFGNSFNFFTNLGCAILADWSLSGLCMHVEGFCEVLAALDVG